jgi:hypothetical protein
VDFITLIFDGRRYVTCQMDRHSQKSEYISVIVKDTPLHLASSVELIIDKPAKPKKRRVKAV